MEINFYFSITLQYIGFTSSHQGMYVEIPFVMIFKVFKCERNNFRNIFWTDGTNLEASKKCLYISK